MSDLFLFNSLGKKKEKFVPIMQGKVGMYTCGMTVYDYAHIGHGRKYVGDDILRRVLEFNGYIVNHVQNVTDVGHLTSDADEGEDKLEKGAKKFGKDVWEVAEFFTKHFYDSMDKLNVLRPTTIAKATEHIKEQIELVEKLKKKGLAYETPEAIYFNTSKFDGYGEMFGQKLSEKQTAVRSEVKKGQHKKNPQDFALWFKRVGRFSDHVMHWESPWGDGFPGWHIECSAMSMKYLGDQFDIHTGGEDHLPVHHPNEIAQAEGATGKKPFVKYWVHHAFLKIDGKKMSKSLGNLFTVEDIEKKGFNPMALRYLFLTSHYRDSQNYTEKALKSAQQSYDKLIVSIAGLRGGSRSSLSGEKQEKIDKYRDEFINAINDDLNTARALAVLWSVVKSNIPSSDKYDLALLFDEVLGLNLGKVAKPQTKGKIIYHVNISQNSVKRLEEREKARISGNFKLSDKIREEIEKKENVTISDRQEGTIVTKGAH